MLFFKKKSYRNVLVGMQRALSSFLTTHLPCTLKLKKKKSSLLYEYLIYSYFVFQCLKCISKEK